MSTEEESGLLLVRGQSGASGSRVRVAVAAGVWREGSGISTVGLLSAVYRGSRLLTAGVRQLGKTHT